MLNGAVFTGDDSDFYLDTGDARRVIIIPPREVWNQPTNQSLRVYGAFTVENVPYPQGSSGNQLCNGRIQCDWIKPHEYFFTPIIGRILLNNNNVLNYNNHNYIPPLTPELFGYFNVNQISGMFRWINTDVLSANVCLDLPLRPGPNFPGGRILTVEKVYDQNHIKAVLTPRFHIEIWPNFTAPGWNFYYMLLLHRQPTNWRFEPVPPGVARVNVDDGRVTKWRLNNYPQAIKCNSEGECCGHILVRQPVQAPPGAGNWWVSIDFGTVNTVVYYRNADDPPTIANTVHPQPMPFPSRGVPITQITDVDRITNVAPHFFPPNNIPDGKFFSLYTQRQIAAMFEPILHGVITYLEPDNMVSVLETEPGLHENLKWTNDPTLRQLIQLYLHQLAIMIMAEAKANGINQVNLRWTYPSAFPGAWAGQMAAIWNNIALHTGINIETPQGLTESFADCKYIVKTELAPVGANYPCIITDIGGGTTDLAVWEQGQLRAHASLELAGRDILNFITINAVLTPFLAIVGGAPVHFHRAPASYLNALLKFHREPLRTIVLANAATTDFRRMRTALAIMFGGVVYYAGLLIRSRGLANVPQVWLCFGGNGSQYRNWIAGDDNSFNSFVTDVIRTALNNNDINVIVNPSPEPKAEASKGALYNYAIAPDAAAVGHIWGADGLRIDGHDYNWDGDVNVIISELRRHKSYTLNDNTILNQLSNFINVLNAHSDNNHLDINRITLTDILRHQIIADCQNFINLEIIGLPNEAQIEKQPLFIKQIKSLLNFL